MKFLYLICTDIHAKSMPEACARRHFGATFA